MGFELTTEETEMQRVAMLIVAESGVGKTSQCRFLPAEETAFLSLESGDLCFKKYNYRPKLKANVSNSEGLTSAFIQLTKGIPGIKYVFVDSLTELAEMVLTELKATPLYADPKNTLKMYGAYNDTMTKIIKSFRDLAGYTVIFTCLSEKEKDGMVSYDDFNIPGSSVKNMLKSFFDVVLHMQAYTEENEEKRVFLTNHAVSRLGKDRSGVLEKVEVADLGKVLTKIIGE